MLRRLRLLSLMAISAMPLSAQTDATPQPDHTPVTPTQYLEQLRLA